MQTKPNTHKLSLIALTVPTWLHHWLVEFHGGSLCHTQSCTRTYNPINVCVLYAVEKRYIYEDTNTFQDSRWIEKEKSNVCVLYFANLVSKSSYVMKNRVTLNRGGSFFFAFTYHQIFQPPPIFFLSRRATRVSAYLVNWKFSTARVCVSTRPKFTSFVHPPPHSIHPPVTTASHAAAAPVPSATGALPQPHGICPICLPLPLHKRQEGRKEGWAAVRRGCGQLRPLPLAWRGCSGGGGSAAAG